MQSIIIMEETGAKRGELDMNGNSLNVVYSFGISNLLLHNVGTSLKTYNKPCVTPILISDGNCMIVVLTP